MVWFDCLYSFVLCLFRNWVGMHYGDDVESACVKTPLRCPEPVDKAPTWAGLLHFRNRAECVRRSSRPELRHLCGAQNLRTRHTQAFHPLKCSTSDFSMLATLVLAQLASTWDRMCHFLFSACLPVWPLKEATLQICFVGLVCQMTHECCSAGKEVCLGP